MRQAQLLGSHREYGKSTAAAAIATYGLGAFLILKKRNVEVLVIDYDNERGGLMGLVLQLPQSTGAHCLSQLANHGVPVRTDVTVPGHGPSKGDQQW